MSTEPFVVHVARLRRSHASSWHEVCRGPVELAGPLHGAGIDPGRSVVPEGADAECDVTLRAFEGGVEVVGFVQAPWEGVCRRCAAPVRGDLKVRVHERYVDVAVAGAEDDLYPIEDDTVDLGLMVRDTIVLELPMAPLCREDCRGLCPHCGTDRNEDECACVAPRDPRWANLDVLRGRP